MKKIKSLMEVEGTICNMNDYPIGKIKTTTYATSEAKAKSNVMSRYKSENNMVQNVKLKWFNVHVTKLD